MKKINLVLFIIACILSCGSIQAKNQWKIYDIAYDVDTLVYKHQVGPGTTYAKYNMPAFPMQVSVLEMDLTNKYIDFETCKGGDKGVAEECPSSMYKRNDRPGHDMVAATNGDFYFYQNVVENGIPRSGQFRRNECVTNPVGRAAFVLTDDRRPFVDRVDFAGKVTFGATTARLHTVNMQRLEWEDASAGMLILYTNSYGTETEYCHGGTKVIITPKTGEFFWSANKNIDAVVKEIKVGEGVTEIPAGSAILYGKGTSEEFVKSLAVGSEISLFLGTNLRAQPGLLTDFKELMGGSNNIILRDGKLVDEQYSRHPRTCIGYNKEGTKVYFILLDGRWSQSTGATMGECAGVFLGLGAWNAVNLDGGGSSCMVVNGEIVNNLSDGKERQVGNGCLLVSNAPIDDAISKIGFAPRSNNIPITSKFIPVIYGYNQYGVLKNKKLEGVKLSCDANIGRIAEDGSFIASAIPGAGKIRASFNGVNVEMDVKIIPAKISLRLNSVLIDNNHNYSIEMLGTNGFYQEKLDPASIAWTSNDTQVCRVENGILIAVKDGETVVDGVGNGFTGSITVKVQLPKSRVQAIDPNLDPKTWKISQTGGTKRVVTPLENGMKIVYTGANGRGPNIKLSKKIVLWSLPDIIRIRINPGDAVIKTINISTTPAIGGNAMNNIAFKGNANEITTVDLPTKDWCDVTDLANYPLTFNSVQFDMGASATGKEFTVEIPGIEAVYTSVEPSGVEDAVTQTNAINAYPNPINEGETAYANIGTAETAFVAVYSHLGQLIKQSTIKAQSNIIALPVSDLAQGTYFVAITAGPATQSVKLIVK
ncbi:MAG: phosphodiester glycosidase family protein [Muribaculaceae bacterium]